MKGTGGQERPEGLRGGGAEGNGHGEGEGGGEEGA